MRAVCLAAMLTSACSAPSPTNAPETPAVAVSAAPMTVSSSHQVAPAGPPKGSVGTAHPMVFLAAGSRGQWVALCQARQDDNGDGRLEVFFGHHGEPMGDQLHTYVVRGSGEGERVDALVAHSEDGRWLVVERGGALELIDTASAKAPIALGGSDASDDPNPFGPHRAASFDAAGKRLLYAKLDGVVVRDLDSGKETTIDLGEGKLWRAHLDAGGEHVFASMVVNDSDGDGMLSLPQARTTLSPRGCRGPAMSWGVYGWHGDQPITKVATVDSAKARLVGEPIGVLSTGELVVRRNDALMGIREGRERELVDAACKARVVHAEGDRLYFGCMSRAVKPTDIDIELPLEIWQDGRRSAGIVVWAEQHDQWQSEDILRRGPNDKAIMLTTGTVATIPEGFHVATWNDRVLKPGLYAGHTIPWALDLDTGKQTDLTPDLGVHLQAQRGSLLAVQLDDDSGAALIDLATLTRKATVQGQVYAIAESGHLLVGERSGRQASTGPLSWRPL